MCSWPFLFFYPSFLSSIPLPFCLFPILSFRCDIFQVWRSRPMRSCHLASFRLHGSFHPLLCRLPAFAFADGKQPHLNFVDLYRILNWFSCFVWLGCVKKKVSLIRSTSKCIKKRILRLLAFLFFQISVVFHFFSAGKDLPKYIYFQNLHLVLLKIKPKTSTRISSFISFHDFGGKKNNFHLIPTRNWIKISKWLL